MQAILANWHSPHVMLPLCDSIDRTHISSNPVHPDLMKNIWESTTLKNRFFKSQPNEIVLLALDGSALYPARRVARQFFGPNSIVIFDDDYPDVALIVLGSQPPMSMGAEGYSEISISTS